MTFRGWEYVAQLFNFILIGLFTRFVDASAVLRDTFACRVADDEREEYAATRTERDETLTDLEYHP